jgi:hypothetical protein
MGMRSKERMKIGEESVEEGGGNIRWLWLNHDRE